MFRHLHDSSIRLVLMSLCVFLWLDKVGFSEEQVAPTGQETPAKTLVPIEQVEGPLPDDFVVAELEGTPILLSEFFESIGLANQLNEVREKVPPSKFRNIQDQRLKIDLRIHLEQRLLARRFLDELTAEESNRLTQGVATVWQEQVDKMIQRINQESGENFSNSDELQKYLREHRQTPLKVLQKQFEDRLMAAELLLRHVTVQDKVKREQATKAFIDYVYANADVRTCLDGTEEAN